MKMFYTAYTNKGNVGDLIITKYQIEEYAKYGVVYVDCHGMPEEFRSAIFDSESSTIIDFEAEYGTSYRSKRIFSVFSILNKQGFTHFCGIPGPCELLEPPLRKMLLKILGAILPAVFLNKRIQKYALGVDINFDFNGLTGMLNRWYFNRFDVIGIRSEDNLKRLEKRMKNVIYIPDMAFLYPGYEADTYDHDNNRIGLSFREVENYSLLRETLIAICALAREHNMTIDLLYQVDEDRSLCNRLNVDLEGYGVRFIDSPIDYHSLAFYRNYDIVISNRLHVLLLSALNGALPFGIISRSRDEQKIKDIFGCVFFSDVFSYLDSFNQSTFQEVLAARNLLRKRVRQNVEAQREICSVTFKNLFVN